MAKNVINSVSYPIEMQKFLEQNPELSLSKIVQSKIIEIMENRKMNAHEIEMLEKRLDHMQKKLWEANEEIDLNKTEILNLKEKIKRLEEKINVLEKNRK